MFVFREGFFFDGAFKDQLGFMSNDLIFFSSIMCIKGS